MQAFGEESLHRVEKKGKVCARTVVVLYVFFSYFGPRNMSYERIGRYAPCRLAAGESARAGARYVLRFWSFSVFEFLFGCFVLMGCVFLCGSLAVVCDMRLYDLCHVILDIRCAIVDI